MASKKNLFWLSTKNDMNFIFKSVFLIIITNIIWNYGIMDIICKFIKTNSRIFNIRYCKMFIFYNFIYGGYCIKIYFIWCKK